MTRLEEVRAILAHAMVGALADDLPAGSPQTNERMAGAICEWMAGLAVLYVTDEELAEITRGENTDQ